MPLDLDNPKELYLVTYGCGDYYCDNEHFGGIFEYHSDAVNWVVELKKKGRVIGTNSEGKKVYGLVEETWIQRVELNKGCDGADD